MLLWGVIFFCFKSVCPSVCLFLSCIIVTCLTRNKRTYMYVYYGSVTLLNPNACSYSSPPSARIMRTFNVGPKLSPIRHRSSVPHAHTATRTTQRNKGYSWAVVMNVVCRKTSEGFSSELHSLITPVQYSSEKDDESVPRARRKTLRQAQLINTQLSLQPAHSRLSKDNWKLFFSRTHFLSFSSILIVYRVLEALIFTFNNSSSSSSISYHAKQQLLTNRTYDVLHSYISTQV